MWWHTVRHVRGSEGETGEWSGLPVLFTLRRKVVYPALLPLLPLMRTPRLPVVDWTDASADLNGLVRFAERRNLVSARVPSHFKRNFRSERWQMADWDQVTWRSCDSVPLGIARSCRCRRDHGAFIGATETLSLSLADFGAGISEVVRSRMPDYRSFSTVNLPKTERNHSVIFFPFSQVSVLHRVVF